MGAIAAIMIVCDNEQDVAAVEATTTARQVWRNSFGRWRVAEVA